MIQKNMISIIIPIYNASSFISKCIDSLILQTYKNLEIILVDDGSTDNSYAICEKYRIKDDRIYLYKKNNGGLSDARNYGLKHIHGEYIMFVDADDWIDLNTCEVLMNVINLTHSDIVMFPYIREYKNKSLIRELFVEDNVCFKGKEIKDKMLRRIIGPVGKELKNPNLLEIYSTAWGKLYKTELLKSIEFIDTKEIGTEDALFNMYVLSGPVNILHYTNKCYYHYRKNNESSLTGTKKYKKQFFLQWKNLYARIEKLIIEKQYGHVYENALNSRIVINLLSLMTNIVNSNEHIVMKYKLMRKVLNDELYKKAYKSFDFKHLSFEWKIFYYSCKYNLHINIYVLIKIMNILKGRV